MSIDWFTFSAQILNFLVLVWLLKRFLYGPITEAMEQRESHIAGRMAQADAAKQQADATEREYRAKLDDQASTREELLAQTAQDVAKWRDDHVLQAKHEVESDRAQWHRDLDRDKDSLIRDLQFTVTRQATDLGGHLLQQLADERLQSRMVSRFIAMLEATDDRDDMLAILGKDGIVKFETTHTLSDGEQQRVVAGLGEVAEHCEIDFRVNPRLVCGIELQTPGFKLAWSFQDSIAEMETVLFRAIEDAIEDRCATSVAKTKNEQVFEASAE